jgi:predicted nuclease with TOPRIM domain
MENCCKCDKYKEEQATQSSRITCLEYENEDQLNRIIVLEKDNQELKKDNKELNNTIITLNNRIIVLENKINNSEFEKIITKFITAI